MDNFNPEAVEITEMEEGLHWAGSQLRDSTLWSTQGALGWLERRVFSICTAHHTAGGERLCFKMQIDSPIMIADLVAEAMDTGPESIYNRMMDWRSFSMIPQGRIISREYIREIMMDASKEIMRQLECRNLPVEQMVISIYSKNVYIVRYIIQS